MTDMERKTFCAALSRYGAQVQITMVYESITKLQDVLCKFLRGRVDGDTLANIAEEIADVGIMLDQMAIEFEVEDAVAEQRAVGAGAAMALGNLDASLSALREHPAVKALGSFDEAGNVDLDKIYTCLKTEAAKGPVTTNIPLIGNVTLNETDVDKLYTLIKQS